MAKDVPNAPMILGRVGPETQPYRAFTGLLVNKNAVRYGNEDRLRIICRDCANAAAGYNNIPDLGLQLCGTGRAMDSRRKHITAVLPRYRFRPSSMHGKLT